MTAGNGKSGNEFFLLSATVSDTAGAGDITVVVIGAVTPAAV